MQLVSTTLLIALFCLTWPFVSLTIVVVVLSLFFVSSTANSEASKSVFVFWSLLLLFNNEEILSDVVVGVSLTFVVVVVADFSGIFVKFISFLASSFAPACFPKIKNGNTNQTVAKHQSM